MAFSKNLAKNESSGWLIYFKSIAISLLIALVIFLIMAVLVTYTSIPESIVPIFTSVIMVLCIALSGMLTAFNKKKKGLLQGLLTGAIYVILIIIASWIFIDEFDFNKYVVLKGIIGIASGGIGGMIGVNL